MKTSVIIPTYNEETDILNCLNSLSEQNYKDFEVIVVDDGSTDATRKRIKKYKTSKFVLKIFTQDHQGPAVARNKGAKHSRGKILVFLDADMTFDKSFLKELVEPIEKENKKGTFSKNEYVSNWNNPWARSWNFMEGWQDKMRHPANYPDEQKVYRAIKKFVFDKAGGFSKGGYTDDYTLYAKIGEMAVAVKGAKFYHRNPSSLGEVYRHAKWVGKRNYKLGLFGYIIAIIRSSLPFSLLKGCYLAIKHRNIYSIPFQIVYDTGIVVGVINYLVTKRGSK